MELNKLNLKFTESGRRLRGATALKKQQKQVGRLKLTSARNYYEAVVMKALRYRGGSTNRSMEEACTWKWCCRRRKQLDFQQVVMRKSGVCIKMKLMDLTT